jgi:membrane associated rhomboid family serine protease
LLSFVLPLNQFGIIPRTTTGLIGVIGAPLLHGSWGHIISNSLALITFVPIFIAVEGKDALEKIFSLAVLTGLLTWGLARPANHIGASGLVFGLYGYLISLGFFNKKVFQVALSMFLLSSYGYILFGIFPVQPGISWESHFFGLISGIFLAKYK